MIVTSEEEVVFIAVECDVPLRNFPSSSISQMSIKYIDPWVEAVR